MASNFPALGLQVPQIRLSDILAMKDRKRQQKREDELFPLELERIKAQTQASQASAGASGASQAKTEQEAKLAFDEQQGRRWAERMATSTDQQSYLTNLGLSVEQGLIPQEHAQRMAEVKFTPDMRKRFQQIAMGQKDYMAATAPKEVSAGATLAVEGEGGEYKGVFTAPVQEQKQNLSDFMQRYYAAKEQEPGLTIKDYEARQKETQQMAGRDVPYPPDVEEQRKRMNANRAQIQGLSPQQFSRAQTLASQFDSNPVVKNFNESSLRFQGVEL